MKKRFEVIIDGKHQGGSFETEAQAKAVGEKLQKKAYVVREKGHEQPKPEPKKAGA